MEENKEKLSHIYDCAANILIVMEEMLSDKENKKAIYVENYDFDFIDTFNEPKLEEFLNKLKSQEYININLNNAKEELEKLLKDIGLSEKNIENLFYPGINIDPIFV